MAMGKDERDGQALKDGGWVAVRHLPEWTVNPNTMPGFGEDAERDVFGAYYDEREAGLIILHYPAPSVAEITWFGVHPYLQSKGIGGALLEAARAHAVAKGCRIMATGLPVEIEGDIQSDHRQNFYKARGFRPTFDAPLREIGRPALWLTLDLSAATP
jgi:GNAT superfamily N-acetyltransferase